MTYCPECDQPMQRGTTGMYYYAACNLCGSGNAKPRPKRVAWGNVTDIEELEWSADQEENERRKSSVLRRMGRRR